MAIYETISDTGFVVGRFDPYDEVQDIVDSEIGEVSLSKAGAGDFWAALGTKVNESQGWTGDKKKKGGSHAVADYRKKRMDRIALAQARRETKMPASLMASHLIPKSTAGKVALATVPAALAIRYNQQASDAAERVKGAVRGGYQKSRDTRRYRPASPYYDDYLGKSSEYGTETLAILDAWISKAGFTAPPGFTGGPPPGSTTGPPPNNRRASSKRPSKRQLRMAEWEATSPEAYAARGAKEPDRMSAAYRGRNKLREPLAARVARVAEAHGGGLDIVGGAAKKVGGHLGAHPGVYAPMAFGAASAGVAGIAARRQAKAARKAAAVEALARKQRNAKLAIAGAASLPLLALAANKKPVEKSDDFEAYMKEIEKGIISAARDARFIRRANRLGANIPPQMLFSEKLAANRASRKAAAAEHKARRVKLGENVPTGAPAPGGAAGGGGAHNTAASGFWGKLNQQIGQAGQSASHAAGHYSNVRSALGIGAPAAVKKPATRLGLTTGQQIGLGAAGAAGLYGGYKLRQPKAQAYQ